MTGGMRRLHVACNATPGADFFRPANSHWTPLDRVRAAIAAVLVALAATGVWSWTHRPYQPLPEAQRVYERGVNALYSMTYETARKALEQAVAIDPMFALAHASLARAYDELDYTDRAKDSMLRAVAAAQDSRLSATDDRKLRALQFMVSRDYARAAPFVQQIDLLHERCGRSRPTHALRIEPPPHSAGRSRWIPHMPRPSFGSGSSSAARAERTNRRSPRSARPRDSIERPETSKA